MLTLGIETSCDETACAVLENSNKLRSNIIATSLAKHKPFGGIVPEIASRYTLETIDAVATEALHAARVTMRDLGLIAVTHGPGLIGSLLVGMAFAKAVSYTLRVPLVGVNHVQAHVYASFIERRLPRKPFIGLVVSGGHTSVVNVDGCTFTELARTRDDACGEAFDKVAKVLGLGFPGGPAIEREAAQGNPYAVTLTCGRIKQSDDFSFSGIKTGVLYYAERCRNLKKAIPDICASFQRIVIERIVTTTVRLAVRERATLIVVGGGVSANSMLRSELARHAGCHGIETIFPSRLNSLDNGAMVARYGYALYKRGIRSDMALPAVPGLGFRSWHDERKQTE